MFSMGLLKHSFTLAFLTEMLTQKSFQLVSTKRLLLIIIMPGCNYAIFKVKIAIYNIEYCNSISSSLPQGSHEIARRMRITSAFRAQISFSTVVIYARKTSFSTFKFVNIGTEIRSLGREHLE